MNDGVACINYCGPQRVKKRFVYIMFLQLLKTFNESRNVFLIKLISFLTNIVDYSERSNICPGFFFEINHYGIQFNVHILSLILITLLNLLM